MNDARGGGGQEAVKAPSDEREQQQRLRKEQEKAQHREAILLAAGEVFSEKGFHYARMEEVAARAGYSAGTIYNYFKSKEDLYVTVIGEGLQKLMDGFKVFLESEAPFEEKLEAVVRNSFELADANRSFTKLMAQQTSYVTAELIGTFTAKGMVWYAQFIDLYAKLMFQGITEGVLRPIDPKDLAHMFLGMQHELFNEWLFSPTDYKLAGKAPFFTDFFLSGAKATDNAAADGNKELPSGRQQDQHQQAVPSPKGRRDPAAGRQAR